MTPEALTRIIRKFHETLAGGGDGIAALTTAVREMGEACADHIILRAGEFMKTATPADQPALKQVPAETAERLSKLIWFEVAANMSLAPQAIAELEREALEAFYARLGRVLRGLSPEGRA